MKSQALPPPRPPLHHSIIRSRRLEFYPSGASIQPRDLKHSLLRPFNRCPLPGLSLTLRASSDQMLSPPRGAEAGERTPQRPETPLLSGTVSPFRAEQGTSLETSSRARASSCQAVGTTWFFSSCLKFLLLREQDLSTIGYLFLAALGAREGRYSYSSFRARRLWPELAFTRS